MGLLLPYLITKHLQEWFFIFVLKSLARTAQRYEFPRKIISKNNISHEKPATISDSWFFFPDYGSHLNHIPAFFFISTVVNFSSSITSTFASFAVGSGNCTFLFVFRPIFTCRGLHRFMYSIILSKSNCIKGSAVT